MAGVIRKIVAVPYPLIPDMKGHLQILENLKTLGQGSQVGYHDPADPIRADAGLAQPKARVKVALKYKTIMTEIALYASTANT